MKLLYALLIAGAAIVVTMPGARSVQSQTSTPTATATATLTPTPTIIVGYQIDSFDNLNVNCFRLTGTESLSCLPGTPIPGSH